MKLANSIVPLKNKLQTTIFMLPKFQETAQRIYKDSLRNPRVKDAYKALRYAIWYGLDITARDEIIACSVEQNAGGCYDYSDAHLDTLLNKVMPTTYLIKMVA
jgi:hypothetical protein